MARSAKRPASPAALIVGGGMTGLAAGWASAARVLEAEPVPGGICSSYYLGPSDQARSAQRGNDRRYRFEIGGGHWIFGGDPLVIGFIQSLAPTKSYRRTSGVYVSKENILIPFPIQNHLRYLDPALSSKAVLEISSPAEHVTRTMADWLEKCFGRTLVDYFFGPFHERYTAGLWTRIAPQDAYKTPVNVQHVIQGMSGDSPPVGYNARFVYPENGLGELAHRIAEGCRIEYGKRVVGIDLEHKELFLEDGAAEHYEKLVSTLPLSATVAISGIEIDEETDPYTSVLVLNIGASRGARCPSHHWLYVPDSLAGFHRIGFYSNVDQSFLPATDGAAERVSLYVERSYPAGARPTTTEIDSYAAHAVRELRDWGFIGEVEVLDPTWIEVAYTWSWPASTWRSRALKSLEGKDVFPVGRYGRWVFQGIADSIRDGFIAGASIS